MYPFVSVPKAGMRGVDFCPHFRTRTVSRKLFLPKQDSWSGLVKSCRIWKKDLCFRNWQQELFIWKKRKLPLKSLYIFSLGTCLFELFYVTIYLVNNDDEISICGYWQFAKVLMKSFSLTFLKTGKCLFQKYGLIYVEI